MKSNCCVSFCSSDTPAPGVSGSDIQSIMWTPHSSPTITGQRPAWATMRPSRSMTYARGPGKSSRGSQYFQRNRIGSTNDAFAEAPNARAASSMILLSSAAVVARNVDLLTTTRMRPRPTEGAIARDYMRQAGAYPFEVVSAQRQFPRPIGREPELLKKLPQRMVPLGGPERKGDRMGPGAPEKIVERVVFDPPRKSTTAQHPGRHRQMLPGQRSRDDPDDAQGTELVLVRNSRHDAVPRGEVLAPLSLAQAHTVQVELIGLVDQFEQPFVIRILRAVEGNPALQAAHEAPVRRARLRELSVCADASLPQPILRLHRPLAEQVTELGEEFQCLASVVCRESQACHGGECRAHLLEFHRTVVDEYDAFGPHVPRGQHFGNCLGFRIPPGTHRKKGVLRHVQIRPTQRFVHHRRLILRHDRKQRAGLRQLPQLLLKEAMDLGAVIEPPAHF